MKIERTKKEVIIRIPATVNVDDLVSDIKRGRWEKTKSKLDL